MATVDDAAAIAAIGSVAFPAVHGEIVGPTFAAAVVEQTYSIAALTECITRCGKAEDAEFLVAEGEGEVLGYLHYDCEGTEPELHRIYVDLERKRRAVKLGPIASRIETLEERIGELEKAQAERGAELSDPAVYADEKRRNRLLNEYQTAATKLEELSSRWEASHEELAALEAELAAELAAEGE